MEQHVVSTNNKQTNTLPNACAQEVLQTPALAQGLGCLEETTET